VNGLLNSLAINEPEPEAVPLLKKVPTDLRIHVAEHAHNIQHLLKTSEFFMKPSTAARPKQSRKPTNVTFEANLLATAKALKINVSQAAELGLSSAVAKRQAELWLEANHGALESSNAYVDQNGLPLARYRAF